MKSPEVDDQVVQTLAAAMEMLASARDYLSRLPPVAVTRAEIERIDEFLRSPETLLARKAADTKRGLDQRRSGWACGANGPALVAVVTATELELSGDVLVRLTDRMTTWRDGSHVPVMTIELEPASLSKPLAARPGAKTRKR